MKIFLTGASGFLGKHLLGRLRSDGFQVTATAQHARPEESIEQLDILDFTAVQSKLDEVRPDIIFHCAALVNLSRSLQVAAKCIDINIKGSLHLLEACRINPPKKFVFASTEEVYGNSELPYKETATPQPPSMYSVSKVAVENISANYAREIGFVVRSIRLATMYGSDANTHRLIPTIINHALKNEPVSLNSGIKKRDYLYIDDAVDCLMKTIPNDAGEQSEIINAGGGISLSLLDLTKKIIAIIGSRSAIQTGAFPDRINEADEWLMDIQKAAQLLNWQPKTSLDTGLQKTIDFYRRTIL